MDLNENPPVAGPVFLIEVEKIKPNPQQPRRYFEEAAIRELASSIREFGILQPLVVTKLERATESGTEVEYQLIAGERRWLASKMAGFERVPAIIRSVNLDKERLELAIVENVQREDLNPIDAARAYAKLQDQFGLTQREIASRIGKSRELVANSIRLLGLPHEMQEAVAKGQLSESQGRVLLAVVDMATQQSLFEDILKNSTSVRELKIKVKRMKGQSADAEVKEVPPPSPDPELISAERELEEALGARVKVEKSGEAGKITITFYSPEELYGIIDKLKDRGIPPAII